MTTIDLFTHLSDSEIIDEVGRLARAERQATARLIGALAELDARRLYLARGCSSLFVYCTRVLHLSEHAAYGRIEAARAARKFPILLEMLAAGDLTLTAVGLLAPHLTADNHRDVLARAKHRTKREVEEIVATVRPLPDAKTLVRKQPAPDPAKPLTDDRAPPVPRQSEQASVPMSSATRVEAPPPTRIPPCQGRAVVKPLAPERYKVQMTVSRETVDVLRRVQDLMRHVVPNGDPAVIFHRALKLLEADLEKRRLAAVAKPRASEDAGAGSRHIPAAVRRAVWSRDGGRCAFVGAGWRCSETGMLELHHVRPFADGGEATVENIELRCRAHNQYEADLFFGAPVVRERREVFDVDSAVNRSVPRAARSGPSTREGRGRVPRPLTPRTSLEHIRKEAKRSMSGEKRASECGPRQTTRHGLCSRPARRRASILSQPSGQSKLGTRGSMHAARSTPMGHSFIQAFRSLRRERTSSLLGLLCLSIAIGTNTTVFSIVNGLILRDLPLGSPDRLVLVQGRTNQDPFSAGPISYTVYEDLASQMSSTMDLAAERRVGLRVSDGGPPERHAASLASWNLFRVLGVRPALGRAFVEEDDRHGAAPVVILSHHLWQQRYGEDPSMIGRRILVGGTPHIVVGVMPRDLAHVALRGLLGARLWVPLGPAQTLENRDDRHLRVYGLLREGVTQASAGARLEAVASHLSDRYAENDDSILALQPLRLGFSPATQTMLITIMGAVGFVLLMACANLANLTLARTTTRRHELATRLALGTPRGRIVLQIGMENLLVALASVPPGILLAFWGRAFVFGSSASPEMYDGIPIDVSVLLYTIGLALVTTLLAGVLPAAYGVRRLDVDVLRAGHTHAARGPRHSILNRLLIGAEAFLSVILLVGTLVFLDSFRTTLRAEGGFDTSPILAVRVETADDFHEPDEDSVRRLFVIIERLSALPGVERVAAATFMPLRDGGARVTVTADWRTQPPSPAAILMGGITATFFDAIDVPVVQGRPLTDAEARSTSPVAVVNRRMAERLWPGESALGRRFKPVSSDLWFTVVGVSENILNWDLSDRPLPTAYVPYPHVTERDPAVFVRTTGHPAAAAPAVRAAVYEASPSTPILSLSTMTDVHRMTLARNQTLARLFGVLGGIALLLGAAGVYSVLSYFVSQRVSEIGIRAALGANPRSLVALFVKQGLTVTVAGLALGVPAAWAVARVLRGRLYNVSAPDAFMFATVGVLLIGVAFAAAYFPARRAAAVDPVVALRQ